MANKLLKSLGLFLAGSLAIWVLGAAGFAIWIILFGLFLISRFSKSFKTFQEWTWLQFLVPLILSLAIPFAVMVYGPGF
jgi:hypothetical protein